jgi:predicted  nucleic acid-binding Zn-ribbon protein
MKKVSVSIRQEQYDTLVERQESGDAGSFSEALRQVLDEYEAVREECEDLRTECEELQTRLEAREDRVDDLEEQLRRRSNVEEKVDELALEVQETRTSSDAPFFVRWARWWRER